MADDIKDHLSNPNNAIKFTSLFIQDCLSPAFGSRSKSEIDLLVFSSLIVSDHREPERSFSFAGPRFSRKSLEAKSGRVTFETRHAAHVPDMREGRG